MATQLSLQSCFREHVSKNTSADRIMAPRCREPVSPPQNGGVTDIIKLKISRGKNCQALPKFVKPHISLKRQKHCHMVRDVTRTKQSWSNENSNRTIGYKDKPREL